MSNVLRILRLALVTASMLLGACAEHTPYEPETDAEAAFREIPAAAAAHFRGKHWGRLELFRALAAMARATGRYHDIDRAIADGFVLLHECEERPGESPAGIVYVRPDRLDGTIDPAQPEGLLYEEGKNGRMWLVGVELAVPYAAWSNAEPPRFFGASFQREDEFGVFGLHVWIWRFNPEGLFAPGNPRVSC